LTLYYYLFYEFSHVMNIILSSYNKAEDCNGNVALI